MHQFAQSQQIGTSATLAYQNNGRMREARRHVEAEREAFRSKVRQNRWADSVVDRLDEICDLEKGWDGYDALPVRYSTCEFVKDVLNQLYSPELPVPDLVPTVAGGVQIEWHVDDKVIEILVSRPYFVECYYDLEDNEDEFDCKSDFSRIAELLKNFAE